MSARALFAAADAWLRPAAPPERLALARVLVGAYALVYVLARLRYFGDLSRHDPSELAPVGVATALGGPLPAWATWGAAALTALAAAAFTAGARFRVSGPALFVALLWITTYRSSWGKILHTENLLVLHVGVLAVAPSAAAVSFDARRSRGAPDEHASGWALTTMGIVTCLTYLVAGLAKLRAGAGGWLSGETMGTWIAFDALRKIELGSLHSPLAAALASSPTALRALAIFTVLVEVGAPLALFTPRTRRL